jgi:hypothetical protein
MSFQEREAGVIHAAAKRGNRVQVLGGAPRLYAQGRLALYLEAKHAHDMGAGPGHYKVERLSRPQQILKRHG